MTIPFFLFSPSTPLRAVSLSNGRFDTGIWQLFNNLYDSHRKLKQLFFKIIPLIRHLFLQPPFAVQYWFFYSSFDVGRSMFDVHLFQ